MQDDNSDSPSAPAVDEEPQEVSFTVEVSFLVNLVWKHRRLLALCTVGAAALSLVFALLAPPLYKASISLYPAMERFQDSSELRELASNVLITKGIRSEVGYHIPEVVRSRRITRRVVTSKWETDKHDKPVDLVTFWRTRGKTRSRRTESAIHRMASRVSTHVNKESGLTTISVLMSEPQLAADIANFIGDAVTEYVQEQQLDLTRRSRGFIEERLRTVREELGQAEEALKEFRVQNRIIADSPELQLESARLQRNVTLKQEVYITLQQQRELAMIEEVRRMPVINVLDKAEKPTSRVRPRTKLIVLSSVLGGFFAALLGVYLLPFIRQIRLE